MEYWIFWYKVSFGQNSWTLRISILFYQKARSGRKTNKASLTSVLSTPPWVDTVLTDIATKKLIIKTIQTTSITDLSYAEFQWNHESISTACDNMQHGSNLPTFWRKFCYTATRLCSITCKKLLNLQDNPVIISKFNKNNYGLHQTLQYNEEITSYQLLGIQYAVYLPI